MKASGGAAFANVAVSGVQSTPPVVVERNPVSSASPTRISKGGIAAATILTIFGFAVMLGGCLYCYMSQNKEAFDSSEQPQQEAQATSAKRGSVFEVDSAYEASSAVAGNRPASIRLPAAESDHAIVPSSASSSRTERI